MHPFECLCVLCLHIRISRAFHLLIPLVVRSNPQASISLNEQEQQSKIKYLDLVWAQTELRFYTDGSLGVHGIADPHPMLEIGLMTIVFVYITEGNYLLSSYCLLDAH